MTNKENSIMGVCSYPILQPLPFYPSLLTSSKPSLQFPIPTTPKWKSPSGFRRLPPISATLNTPRGFGTSPKKSKKPKRGNNKFNDDDEDEEEEEEGDEEEEGREEDVIPEIVTNRMMNRMGFSVGIPLFIGLLFFPFFYYLKVGLKIDVPNWIPLMVSFIFFGTALLGVSYGIVSSSWDPMREGSLLGWNEAQKNFPVFLQSIWGGGGSKKK